MPSYNFKAIEPRWQQYWEEHKAFRTPDSSDKPKYYVLDMFPYPSGSGLHVGHPEGYTATDILCRYRRMKGFNVLHPMGWDAFGLPAEQYAITTGTHPRQTTQNNIATFRRQIKMLGFSYDWDREVDTTDPHYFKWTQWIFLQLFATWYDADQKRGRPIAELPIPPEVQANGETAVRAYQDGKRLAYQAEVPVNWCAALGTVLANEEVIDGKSERGGHPVVRMPLRQWLLRITAYAERLLEDLEPVDWPEPIKKQQRDWIGRSEGAEVDFQVVDLTGASAAPTIRVFTTRPDTLFGATYMVLAPEHPLVDQITTDRQRAEVAGYRAQAARKSDLERTESKKKTGKATGAFAINPVNKQRIPIWIADYVLIGYGTGAIMAVPAHDERDFEFAKEFHLPIKPVVMPPEDWLRATSAFKAVQHLQKEADGNLEGVAPPGKGTEPEELPQTLPQAISTIVSRAARMWDKFGKDPLKVTTELYRTNPEMFEEVFADNGTAFNSGEFNGLPTPEFKARITSWLEERKLGCRRVNYKLRDWLFSRQRYWGEPFPILHEVDATGKPTGMVRALTVEDLPLLLPDVEDYRPTGRPEPPLEKATDWVWVTRDGKRYKRETNTMPQWAGSCWYFLRYIDPKNESAFCDPAKEKYWLPVDLYVGGAEHAVLHLLYSRFWHKVLFDRGHVHTPEPFQKLINQGMILGEVEYTGFRALGEWVSADRVQPGEAYHTVTLEEKDVEKRGSCFVLKRDPSIQIDPRTTEQGKVQYTGFRKIGDWVSASNDIDPETGKHQKTGAEHYCVRLDEERVEKKEASFVLNDNAKVRIDARAFKMSKSRGNVINPDKVVDEYGADSLRLYEMFMGPLEATKPWSTRGVEGVYRFLSRVWRLMIDDRAEEMKLAAAVQEVPPEREALRELHRTIQKVTEDLETQPVPRFNTAISAMMEFTNYLTPLTARPKSVLEPFVLLLAPFAPHIAEELWAALGHKQTLAYEPWPSFDPALTKADAIEVPVQINGKLKARLMVPPDINEEALKQMALADERVKAALEGKQVRKVIIPAKGGKLVNIVCG